MQCKANISSKETTIYAKKADYFQAAAQLCHPAGGTHSSAGLFSPTEDQLPALQALKHRTKLSFLFFSSEGINLHRHTPYPHAVSLQKHSFTEAGGKPDCCRTGVGRAQAAALSAEHSAFRQLWIFHLKNNGYILSNYTAAAMLFEVPKIQRNKTRLFDIRALTPSIIEAPVTLQIFAVPIFFNLSYIQGWLWFLVHASSASTSWLSSFCFRHSSCSPFPAALPLCFHPSSAHTLPLTPLPSGLLSPRESSTRSQCNEGTSRLSLRLFLRKMSHTLQKQDTHLTRPVPLYATQIINQEEELCGLEQQLPPSLLSNGCRELRGLELLWWLSLRAPEPLACTCAHSHTIHLWHIAGVPPSSSSLLQLAAHRIHLHQPFLLASLPTTCAKNTS